MDPAHGPVVHALMPRRPVAGVRVAPVPRAPSTLMMSPVESCATRAAITWAGTRASSNWPSSLSRRNGATKASPTRAGDWARREACIALSTPPGRTAFTVTPVPASAAARWAVSISNPALLTEYALAWPKPVPVAAPVETFTLRPQRRARPRQHGLDTGEGAREVDGQRRGPRLDVDLRGRAQRRHDAHVVDEHIHRTEAPLDLCDRRTDRRGIPTSQVTPLLACPASRRRAANRAISSVERASPATLAPAAARAAAVAAPMPRPAPVTSATRPRTVYPLGSSMDHSFFLSFLSGVLHRRAGRVPSALTPG